MAEVVRLPKVPRPHAETKLDVSQDDFSVKVSAAGDARFWVRLELGRGQEAAVVTDFNPGGLGELQLIKALSLALRRSGVEKLDTLVFQDVVPGGTPTNQGPRLIAARQLTQDAALHVAAEWGQTVKAIQLEERLGKINIRIALA